MQGDDSCDVTDRGPVFVLLSGGIDSSATVAFFRKQGAPVSALYVDYGQIASDRERVAASEIARHFRIDLRQVRCSGMSQQADGYVPGRNAFLAFLGLMQAPFEAGLIALGVHAGTAYWDCSDEFARTCQAVLNGYSGGRIRLHLPFLRWNKRQIWEFCREGNLPLNKTYSCELGQEQPCGRCSSCADLEALRAL